jgi:hypothetical protein
MDMDAGASRVLRRTWLAVALFMSYTATNADAQPWDKILTEIQQVTVSHQCWDWKAPLESDCGGAARRAGSVFSSVGSGELSGTDATVGSSGERRTHE